MSYEMLTGRLPFGTVDTPIGPMADLIRRGEYQALGATTEWNGETAEVTVTAQ